MPRQSGLTGTQPVCATGAEVRSTKLADASETWYHAVGHDLLNVSCKTAICFVSYRLNNDPQKYRLTQLFGSLNKLLIIISYMKIIMISYMKL